MLSLTRCAYGARSTPARPTPAVHTVRADCRAAQGCVPRPTKATSQRLGADWRRRGPGGVGVGVGGHGRVTRCLRRRGGGCCYAGEADTSAFTNSISALSSEQLAERVVWLPPMRRSNASASVMPDFDAATAETTSANNMRTMPFFALGKEPYLPGSEQVLNIFEPRYREMYNDILFNGSRQFVVSVASDDPAESSFAKVGVVFYLEDLKEVSGQTDDRIKYVVQHKVIGRVKINKIVNPDVWWDRSTYLKVEVEDFPDSDEGEDCTETELRLLQAFDGVMSMQVELGVAPRFVDELRGKLDLSRSNDGGLWRAVSLWQEFSHQRIQGIRSKANTQIQELLLPFVNKAERTPSGQYMVNFDQLPDNIKGQVKAIQEQNRDEELQYMRDPFLPFQLIVQEPSHTGRLLLLAHMVEEEQKRLQARLSLKTLFASSGDGDGDGDDSA